MQFANWPWPGGDRPRDRHRDSDFSLVLDSSQNCYIIIRIIRLNASIFQMFNTICIRYHSHLEELKIFKIFWSILTSVIINFIGTITFITRNQHNHNSPDIPARCLCQHFTISGWPIHIFDTTNREVEGGRRPLLHETIIPWIPWNGQDNKKKTDVPNMWPWWFHDFLERKRLKGITSRIVNNKCPSAIQHHGRFWWHKCPSGPQVTFSRLIEISLSAQTRRIWISCLWWRY